MDVPVQLGALVEGRVVGGEEAAGDPGGAVAVDEVVEKEGDENLMDVEGETGEVEGAGEGRREGREEWRVVEEGVEHGCLRELGRGEVSPLWSGEAGRAIPNLKRQESKVK